MSYQIQHSHHLHLKNDAAVPDSHLKRTYFKTLTRDVSCSTQLSGLGLSQFSTLHILAVIHDLSCCGIKKCQVLSKLDAVLCLVTLDFILQYEEWRMYRLLILFDLKYGFIFMKHIQVQ